MTAQNKATAKRPAELRWRNADAYLFDIDGTLLNSRDGVHYNAFRRALREVYGLDMTIDGVPVHGNTDVGILRAVVRNGGLSDEIFGKNLSAAIQLMCEDAGRNAAEMSPMLCSSVAELLNQLHAVGKLLGVVSGNLEPIGWSKLEAAGVRHLFAFGSFSGARELRQEIFSHGLDEARRRLGNDALIYFVGDTPADVAAAKAVGAPIIAVATGIYELEELRSHGPEWCVSCCTELLSD